MDVKAAVDLAKRHVADLFGNEGVINVGLEEVEYDEGMNGWRITIGFSRPWDKQTFLSAIDSGMRRSYKVVSIDDDGKVLSVKNRETTSA